MLKYREGEKLNLPNDMRNWSIEHVLQWLANDMNMIEYCEMFENHKIDGKSLLLLNDHFMVKLGVKIGDILKIKEEIQKYRV